MSWLKALVAMSVLALSLDASAGGRVDWSEYIDRDAPRSAPTSTASTSSSAPTAKKAKTTKAKKKKVSAKTRKARAKKSRR
jgi:hypothetical protein